LDPGDSKQAAIEEEDEEEKEEGKEGEEVIVVSKMQTESVRRRMMFTPNMENTVTAQPK
jgi:hypothetical protein